MVLGSSTILPAAPRSCPSLTILGTMKCPWGLEHNLVCPWGSSFTEPLGVTEGSSQKAPIPDKNWKELEIRDGRTGLPHPKPLLASPTGKVIGCGWRLTELCTHTFHVLGEPRAPYKLQSLSESHLPEIFGPVSISCSTGAWGCLVLLLVCMQA